MIREFWGSAPDPGNFGLSAKAAHLELAALIGHVGLRSSDCRREQGAAFQQPRHQKQSYHGNTEAEIGQGELRQQRDRAPTGAAQIPAHADGPIKAHIHQSAAIKAVAKHLLQSPTMRAMVGAAVVRIGEGSGKSFEMRGRLLPSEA